VSVGVGADYERGRFTGKIVVRALNGRSSHELDSTA
jgi:hypothetical protein